MKIKDKIKKLIKRNNTNKNKKNKYTIEDIYELADLTGELKIINNNHNVKKTNSITLSNTKPNINEYIEEFIDWYLNFFKKDCYTNIGKYTETKKLRNFIEKMAIWYELRYPDYEVYKIIDSKTNEEKSIDEIMFTNNPYLKRNIELTDETFNTDEAKRIDWVNFYNFTTFYNSLPDNEKRYLHKPAYPSLIYITPDYKSIHLHLTNNGYIEVAENLTILTNNKYTDEFFTGFHIKELLTIINEENITLPKNNQIEKAIKIFEERKYFYEEILNCVMYRIIERGGNRVGPRRAFIFAKEFNRNINIPLIYGIDTTDPRLRYFINEYLKSGGNTDLICYVNYFFKTNDNQERDTISIKKLLSFDKDYKYRYTNEEKKLQETLTGIIANNIDYQKLKKEEVKQLRLIKKLEKSKRNYKIK